MTHPITHSAFSRRPAALRRTPLGRIAGALAAAWRTVARHRAMRRDEYFLLSQPDYILRDIGIGRGEIETAVRGRRR
jgi:uncharacterized protein YjiS (DUF1127 family)